MRKFIPVLLALSLLSGVGSADLLYDCPLGVGPYCVDPVEPLELFNNSSYQNQSQPEVELEKTSSSCTNNRTQSVEWQSYVERESYPTEHHLQFTGTLIGSNPCQKLGYNISQQHGNYSLNIYSIPQEVPCIQCLGAVNYNAEFTARTNHFHGLEVLHNGESIDYFSPNNNFNLSPYENRTVVLSQQKEKK